MLYALSAKIASVRYRLYMEMCIDGMNMELLYILKGIKHNKFQELVMRAHDMEITVKGRRKKHTSSLKL